MKSLENIEDLRVAYKNGRQYPREVVAQAQARASQVDSSIWIHQLGDAMLSKYINGLEAIPFDEAPLWGVPFAIKDNIDLQDVPTTAGCPDYAYVARRSATVVERLVGAGAIPIGKANLDQFATGLTGTRSPYGAVFNAFDRNYIAGGSSSGSAAAVKQGLVSFALGTDTAGSGRIPAAFNGLIGFKPTRGWLSTRGVVPACRSLDCVSIFANSVRDAFRVADVAGGFDTLDPFSRRLEFKALRSSTRLGHFPTKTLSWRGNSGYESAYARFIGNLHQTPVEVNPQPFLEVGELLYGGPWVAERIAAVGDFLEIQPESVHPITRTVLDRGRQPRAVDYFKAQYQLAALRREIDKVFEMCDVVLSPTAPTIFTHAEVARDPFGTNSVLGMFTHCANLLDLCAIAIPAGLTPSGLPFGVSLLAPAGYDRALSAIAGELLGESINLPIEADQGVVQVAVCGAHMTGQPLNGELLRRQGQRTAVDRTVAHYRLFALPDGKRPALVRSKLGGKAIEVEVWSLPSKEVGGFLASIEPPLTISLVELECGGWVPGFVGETDAQAGARDITHFGGWRKYRASRNNASSSKSTCCV